MIKFLIFLYTNSGINKGFNYLLLSINKNLKISFTFTILLLNLAINLILKNLE